MRNQPGDEDEGVENLTQQQKKHTQEEQDVEDEKARKRAMKNLVNSWQERLQLISVITTFFASTEAGMLVNTKPANETDLQNNILKASNATLLGALIVHVYAAVLSFLAAFLLIRYKLKEATREELIAEGIKMVSSPLGGSMRVTDVERDLTDILDGTQSLVDAQRLGRTGTMNSVSVPQTKRDLPFEPPVLSREPHLEQVGPFSMSSISNNLLSRIHALCVLLAAVGFVLAITGILCYAWALQPLEVSIFASTCLGGAILAMVVLFI
jgi:hypothetical protein